MLDDENPSCLGTIVAIVAGIAIAAAIIKGLQFICS